MKSSTVIFFLLIAAGLFYLFHSGYLTIDDIPFIEKIIEKPIAVDEDLGNFLKENNYKILDFSDSSPMLLKFSSDSLLDMDAQVYSVAKKTYEVYNKPLIVQGYFLDNPMLSLSSSDLSIKDNFNLEDMRTDEFRIENDLGIFDVLIDYISLKDNDLELEVEYLGDEEDFFDDFAAMSFVIVQDSPQIKQIKIDYVKLDMCLSMKTSSSNVLSLYNEEISMDDFLGSLELEKCEVKKQANTGTDIVSKENPLEGCPSKEESYSKYVESNSTLAELMSRGEGDLPEAQVAYKNMKFYRDCYEMS
ncbi:MAG: hypothetical protein DRH70_09530 [Candidatus Coatesbacteria bacterium]|nr:MAG: hypothetical protein DRH70_09530 [Candidatus Coatesbacteria bacterium]